MPYLCNFGLKVLKSFIQKEKSLNLRPKMSFWVFLDLELEKTIEIFGISTLKFAEMQKIVQNKKKQKQKIFGPKMPYSRILGCEFEKVLSYLQHPRVCQNAKFRARLKIFGTKLWNRKCLS